MRCGRSAGESPEQRGSADHSGIIAEGRPPERELPSEERLYAPEESFPGGCKEEFLGCVETPTAEQDPLRAQHVRQGRENHTEVSPGFLERPVRTWIAAPGGIHDFGRRGEGAPRILRRVAQDGGHGRGRFGTPAPPAGAPLSTRIHNDVPRVTQTAAAGPDHGSVCDHSGANPGAESEHEQPANITAPAEEVFPYRRRVGVIVQRGGAAKSQFQRGAEGKTVNAGKVGDVLHPLSGVHSKTGRCDSHAFKGVTGSKLGGRARQCLNQRLGTHTDTGRDRRAAVQAPGSVYEPELGTRPPDIHSQPRAHI